MLQYRPISDDFKAIYQEHAFPQNVDVLRNLLGRLEHLDLTNKLSEDPIVQRADGGFGEVYSANVWIGERKVPVALKRIKVYVQKDKDFAMVCLPDGFAVNRIIVNRTYLLIGSCKRDTSLVSTFPSKCASSSWVYS